MAVVVKVVVVTVVAVAVVVVTVRARPNHPPMWHAIKKHVAPSARGMCRSLEWDRRTRAVLCECVFCSWV